MPQPGRFIMKVRGYWSPSFIFGYLPFFLLAILLLLGTPTGCKKQGLEETYPVRIETEDGLRVVSNPDFPREGKITPVVVEELSIGGKEGQADYLFNRPIWIKVDNQERIYVMDWGDVCIKVFDSEGLMLQSIGRKGQGPGDFDIPAYFDLMPDGRMAIMDGRNQRVTFLDMQGNYTGSFRVEGYTSGMSCDSQGRVYFQKQTTQIKLETTGGDFQAIPYTTTIYRSDPEGKNLEKIGDFEGVVRGIRRTREGMISISPPFAVLWTVDNQDRLVVGLNARFDLTVFGPDLQPQFRFRRDYELLKDPTYQGKPWQNEYYPAFERFIILTDDEGNIWLERAIPPKRVEPQEEGGRPEWIRPSEHIYDVFNSEGIYIREITVPFRIYCVKKGKVYARTKTEEGFYLIKRYRLEGM